MLAILIELPGDSIMKNKNREFVFLDPAAAQTRHNRIQFMLDDDEYAVLVAAAAIQSSKPSDLAGTLFRKHILPGLGAEVRRLREKNSEQPSITPVGTLRNAESTSPGNTQDTQAKPPTDSLSVSPDEHVNIGPGSFAEER
jgi:hypothetical protein